jgi:amino acid transporter
VLTGLATGGYYVGFAFPIVGFLFARARGRWTPGPTWRFGRVGLILNIAALVWLTGEFINIAWPRSPSLPWYQNWAVEVGIAIIALIGGIYFALTRPDRKFALEPERERTQVVPTRPHHAATVSPPPYSPSTTTSGLTD